MSLIWIRKKTAVLLFRILDRALDNLAITKSKLLGMKIIQQRNTVFRPSFISTKAAEEQNWQVICPLDMKETHP